MRISIGKKISSPVTIARYDKQGEAGKRKAANLLHTPYIRSQKN
ncbi:hypothetical protein [Chlorogloea sp. CCALA 695]|nr:hypothetical protein [Chlorogloea sp. CCALA 695]